MIHGIQYVARDSVWQPMPSLHQHMERYLGRFKSYGGDTTPTLTRSNCLHSSTETADRGRLSAVLHGPTPHIPSLWIGLALWCRYGTRRINSGYHAFDRKTRATKGERTVPNTSLKLYLQSYVLGYPVRIGQNENYDINIIVRVGSGTTRACLRPKILTCSYVPT